MNPIEWIRRKRLKAKYANPIGSRVHGAVIEWHHRGNRFMKKVEILGDNRFETFTKIRDGSRAVIVKGGKSLLTHELN